MPYFNQLSDTDRKLAGQTITALSACCILGIFLGVLTTQHQWLSARSISTKPGAVDDVAKEIQPPLYLRSAEMKFNADLIDVKKTQHFLKDDEAYQQMYKLASEGSCVSPENAK